MQPGVELQSVVHELGKIATVGVRQGSACISLICNVTRTSEILQRVSVAWAADGAVQV